MKKKIHILLLFCLLFFCVFLYSCGNSDDKIETFKLNKITETENLAVLKEMNGYLAGVYNDDSFSGAVQEIKLYDREMNEKSNLNTLLSEGSLYYFFGDGENIYTITSKKVDEKYKYFLNIYDTKENLISSTELDEYSEPDSIIYKTYKCGNEFIFIYPESIRIIDESGKTSVSIPINCTGLSCLSVSNGLYYLYTVEENYIETENSYIPIVTKIDISKREILKQEKIESIPSIQSIDCFNDVLYIMTNFKIKAVDGTNYTVIKDYGICIIGLTVLKMKLFTVKQCVWEKNYIFM